MFARVSRSVLNVFKFDVSIVDEISKCGVPFRKECADPDFPDTALAGVTFVRTRPSLHIPLRPDS